jgi:hypothetical protein
LGQKTDAVLQFPKDGLIVCCEAPSFKMTLALAGYFPVARHARVALVGNYAFSLAPGFSMNRIADTH